MYGPIEGDEITSRGIAPSGIQALLDIIIAGCEKKLLVARLELKWLNREPMTTQEIIDFAEHLATNPERKEYLASTLSRQPISAEAAPE